MDGHVQRSPLLFFSLSPHLSLILLSPPLPCSPTSAGKAPNMFSRYFIFVFVLSYIFFQSLSGKDRVLVILENAQNWLEQPSVGKDGRIQTDLYGKGLSYTVRSACTNYPAQRSPLTHRFSYAASASSLIRITAMQVAQFPRAGQAFNVTLGFRNDQTVTVRVIPLYTTKAAAYDGTGHDTGQCDREIAGT